MSRNELQNDTRIAPGRDFRREGKSQTGCGALLWELFEFYQLLSRVFTHAKNCLELLPELCA